MAEYTTEENQELIETIRNPIRHYRITVWGYGGEAAYLKLTKEQYEFWKAKDEEEYDTTLNYILECEDNGKPDWVPEEMDFMAHKDSDGETYYNSWYDAPTEVSHQFGTPIDGAHITIDEVESDEYNSSVIKTVFETKDAQEWCNQVNEESDYEVDLIEWVDLENEYPEYILQFYSSEKGTFFDGQFSTRGPIDLNKLKFNVAEHHNGEDIIEGISYDGEEINNNGAETNGKGYSVHMWSNE